MTGTELKTLREKAGVSQESLGRMLGMSKTKVSLMERGALPIDSETEAMIGVALVESFIRKTGGKEVAAPKKRGRPRGWVDREAKEEWDRKTAEELKRRGEIPEPVKNDLKSTDRHVISTKSTDPVEVRMCAKVELGPETMKALKDMIETAIREMKAEAINPEVIQAAKEGAEYRRKTQAILGRGW